MICYINKRRLIESFVGYVHCWYKLSDLDLGSNSMTESVASKPEYFSPQHQMKMLSKRYVSLGDA